MSQTTALSILLKKTVTFFSNQTVDTLKSRYAFVLQH